MRILIITNLYPPYVQGGAEVVAARMAEGLRDALQHVSVLTTMPFRKVSSLVARAYELAGIRVYRFFPLNVYHYIHGGRFPWFIRVIWHGINMFNVHAAWQVWRVLRAEKPDLVITHNLMGLGFLIPLVIAAARIRHFHVLHDVQLITPTGIIVLGGERSVSVRLLGWIGYRRYMKRVFRHTAAIISPSSFLLEVYARYGFFEHQRTIVLPNPVDIPEKASGGQRGPELGLLYVGQVTRAKGAVGLIETLRRSDMHFKLSMVGAGADLEQCLRRASGDPRFTFYGWQPRKFVVALLGVSDAVIAPTLCYDTSPTIVFESLSFGVPVISSDLGGAKEIVRHGYNGWIFEAGNWEQLRHIISTLVSDRSKVSFAATNARASVARYSTKQYIDRLLSLCQSGKR